MSQTTISVIPTLLDAVQPKPAPHAALTAAVVGMGSRQGEQIVLAFLLHDHSPFGEPRISQ